MASLVVHAALITGALILAQAPEIADVTSAPVQPVVIYRPPEPSPQLPNRPGQPVPSGVANLRPIAINVPDIPTFDVTRSYTPSVAPVDVFNRSAGPIVPSPTSPSGEVHTWGEVQRVAASLPGNGSPDYPRTLRTAGVEGSVVVTFVVDTLGRAERGSITIVSTTHPLFADAVQHWLARTRYAPAEINGRRVRQLVQQEVGFSLAP